MNPVGFCEQIFNTSARLGDRAASVLGICKLRGSHTFRIDLCNQMRRTSRVIRRFPAVVILALGMSGLAEAQLVNGSMAPPFVPISGDAASGSVPNGWTPQGTNNADFVRDQSTINSPFTSVYADNASSAHIKDTATGTTGTGGFGFLQLLGPGYTSGTASFDFMLDNMPATGGTFGVQFNNTGNLTGGSSVTRLRFELNNAGSLRWFSDVGNATILTIAEDTWYHVAFAWNESGAFSGTATPFGGTGTGFSGTLSPNGANNISGVQVRDRENTPGGDLYLDNVSVVPEPAVAGLLGAAGLALMIMRRRMTSRIA